MRNLFAKKVDASPNAREAEAKTWKIIVADDEPSVHEITEMALASFRFEGRGLRLIHAYSGEEAVKAVGDNPDAACILLDVVMEEEHAGLAVAQKIRQELGNKLIRIVLRTGQPGMAPEAEVVAKYDIHDYKEKTEITSRKLTTLMHSCLRSYRDLHSIERARSGLSQIIDTAPSIFQLNSLPRFVNGALAQLIALSRGSDGVYGNSPLPEGVAAELTRSELRVLAGTGRFSSPGPGAPSIPQDVIDRVLSRQVGIQGDWLLETFPGQDQKERFLYIEGITSTDDLDLQLLKLFTRNLSIAFDNIRLKEEIEATQKEIVYRLGEAVESRNHATGNHVKRVALCSAVVAAELGLSAEQIELIEYASPLHDVGKIGIPDAVLNKPGRLSGDEWGVMQAHTLIGYQMLREASQPILQAGAVIALQHHERWDGSGYPNRLARGDIDRLARIVSVVDVFDALGSRRPYKVPWELPRIVAEILSQREKAFDPEVVDAVIALADRLHGIRQHYPDPIHGAEDGKE